VAILSYILLVYIREIFGDAWFRQSNVTTYKQIVFGKRLKTDRKITGKNQIFVVLKKELLFLDMDAEPVMKDRFSAEPAEELIAV